MMAGTTGKIVRAVGLGTGPAAGSLTIAFEPALGAVVLLTEMAFVLILFAIVVFGTQEQADRVFRLLRWLRNSSEPPVT